MSRFVLSPEPKNDIRAIQTYIARDNLSAARHTTALLKDKCRALAANPRMGRAREELAPDLRSFPAGNCNIFYRIVRDSIETVRILHGAQDIDGQFPGIVLQ